MVRRRPELTGEKILCSERYFDARRAAPFARIFPRMHLKGVFSRGIVAARLSEVLNYAWRVDG